MKWILAIASLLAVFAVMASLSLLYKAAEWNPPNHDFYWTMVFFYIISGATTSLLPVLIRREILTK